ncbi:MAG: hypothetical protein R2692_07035 [Microbacterium sp.]
MGMTRGRRYLAPIALAGVFGLVLTGCAEGGSDTPGASGSAGGTVRISGGITGSEADLLQQSFDGFTKDTGIEVVYTGDKGFEGNIVTKVTGGDAPDLAIVPQPGLLKTLIGTGDVVKAPSAVDQAVGENWSPDWKAYGTVDGTFYAAPMLANVKRLRLVLAGEVQGMGRRSRTWDDLLAHQTIQVGAAPWCAGFESGNASGWRAPTGSRTSCCVSRARACTTTGWRAR